MFKFLIKTFGLSCIVVCLYVAIFLILPVEGGWQHTTVFKDTLLRNTESPKLICVGGSNVSYSVDSEKLSMALDRNVVNLGFISGAGIELLLEQALEGSSRGDIVVVMSEYEHFTKKKQVSGDLYLALAYDKSLFRYLSYSHLSGLMKNMPVVVSKRIFSTISYYSVENVLGIDIFKWELEGVPDLSSIPEGLNRFGDIKHDPLEQKGIYQFDEKTYDESKWISSEDEIDYRLIDRVARKCQQFEEKGVKVFFLPPTLVADHYLKYKGIIEKVYRSLQERIGENVKKSPLSHVLNDRYFYDSQYHLNYKGQEVFVQRLIEFLEKELSREE